MITPWSNLLRAARISRSKAWIYALEKQEAGAVRLPPKGLQQLGPMACPLQWAGEACRRMPSDFCHPA